MAPAHLDEFIGGSVDHLTYSAECQHIQWRVSETPFRNKP
jgi:hypothetical protein